MLRKSRRDGNIAIGNDNLDRALTQLKRKVDPQDSFNTEATESMSSISSSEDDSSYAASSVVSTSACCSSTPSSFSEHGDDDHSPKRRSCLRKPGTPRRAVSLLVRGEMELWLPNKHEPVTKSTCIVFNETVRVKKVRPVRQLTDNHKALWFSDEEYVAMKDKCRRLAYRVENGMTNGRKYCVRGLESLMVKVSCDKSDKDHQQQLQGQRRRTSSDKRKVGLDAVLDEQDVQYDLGEYNDERIAYKYKQTSVYSKRQALYLASLDEQDAQAFLFGGVKASTSTSTTTSVPPPPAATLAVSASSDHAIAA